LTGRPSPRLIPPGETSYRRGVGKLVSPLLEPKPVNRYNILDLVMDERGRPRLKQARREILPLHVSSIPVLGEAFDIWQTFDEYMVLRDMDLKTGEINYFGVKCSKRGNDVFVNRMKKKLGFLKKFNGVEAFSTEAFTYKHRIKVGPPVLLWATLTYDSKRCRLDQAWNNYMKEFNILITKLRQKYGRIWYISFPQPFPGDGLARGYPHMHILFMFMDTSFEIFRHMEQNSVGGLQLVYRVHEKDEIHEVGGWHSFMDIKALRSGEHAYNYAMQYAQRSIMGMSSDKSQITNSILWIYKKKSYNVSGAFRDAYSEFIRTMRNSKGQLTLDGEILPTSRVEFVGIYGLDEIRRIKEIKDPPGWVVALTSDHIKELDANRGKAIYS